VHFGSFWISITSSTILYARLRKCGIFNKTSRLLFWGGVYKIARKNTYLYLLYDISIYLSIIIYISISYDVHIYVINYIYVYISTRPHFYISTCLHAFRSTYISDLFVYIPHIYQPTYIYIPLHPHLCTIHSCILRIFVRCTYILL